MAKSGRGMGSAENESSQRAARSRQRAASSIAQCAVQIVRVTLLHTRCGTWNSAPRVILSRVDDEGSPDAQIRAT